MNKNRKIYLLEPDGRSVRGRIEGQGLRGFKVKSSNLISFGDSRGFVTTVMALCDVTEGSFPSVCEEKVVLKDVKSPRCCIFTSRYLWTSGGS